MLLLDRFVLVLIADAKTSYKQKIVFYKSTIVIMCNSRWLRG